MKEPAWRSALRERWLAEYGGRFTAQEIAAALDEVALFRRYGARIARESLDLGEMPFSCLLPASLPETQP
ncbi:MAG: hypothetical protein ACHQZQ_00415 [SAR324 cluster bacterium]